MRQAGFWTTSETCFACFVLLLALHYIMLLLMPSLRVCISLCFSFLPFGAAVCAQHMELQDLLLARLPVNEDRALFGPPIWPHWASWWLIFRSPGLPKPLLAHFWLLLASLKLLLLSLLDFPNPKTLPEPRNSMKNHWFSYVFGYFHISLTMAELSSNKLPKGCQEASKAPPSHSKTLPRCPKMAPRRL